MYNLVCRKQIFLFFILFLSILILTQPVFAAGSGGGLPYEDWLDKLVDSVTGRVAYSVSIIGMVSSGLLLILGGEFNTFFKTLTYMVLVFSITVAATNTLESLTGRGAEISDITNVMIINKLNPYTTV